MKSNSIKLLLVAYLEHALPRSLEGSGGVGGAVIVRQCVHCAQHVLLVHGAVQVEVHLRRVAEGHQAYAHLRGDTQVGAKAQQGTEGRRAR